MNHAPHLTLWCEAHLRFYDIPSLRDRSYNTANLQPGQKIYRHYNAAYADEYECPSITIYSPDWKEEATYHTSQHRWGYHYNFRTYRNKHGHNWHNVTRIDVTFMPADVPFYYSGKIYTGGLSSHTCQLRRLKSTHQASQFIPANATLTPLPDYPGVTEATWTTRRHCRHGWLDRTQHHTTYLARSPRGWLKAPSPDQTIAALVLHRLNLQAA